MRIVGIFYGNIYTLNIVSSPCSGAAMVKELEPVFSATVHVPHQPWPPQALAWTPSRIWREESPLGPSRSKWSASSHALHSYRSSCPRCSARWGCISCQIPGEISKSGKERWKSAVCSQSIFRHALKSRLVKGEKKVTWASRVGKENEAYREISQTPLLC